MKSHKFSVDDAINFGVQKALLLEHLKWHQENNEGIETYEVDGKVWCHAKRSTLKKMYPYFSGRSISRWLEELEDEGIIESKKPKIKRSDHTKYYRVKGYREPLKGNGQNGQSAETLETDIQPPKTPFKANQPNGQNGQSNGQNGRSMNGQIGQSTIYNLCEETTMDKARVSVLNILKKIPIPPALQELFEVKGFPAAYLDWCVHVKETKNRWPTPTQVQLEWKTLFGLLDDGHDPVKSIHKRIKTGWSDFYAADDKKGNLSSDEWDQQHLNNPAYREV